MDYESIRTDEYPQGGARPDSRMDQDLVGQFLHDCCLLGAETKVTKDLLYTSWRGWFGSNGEFEVLDRSKKWLTQQLGKRGYEPCGAGNKARRGLGMGSGSESANLLQSANKRGVLLSVFIFLKVH